MINTNSFKERVRKLIPSSMLDYLGKIRRYLQQRNNLNRTVEEIFTDIYVNNKWGGKAGEFCSGSGSSSESAVLPYVSTISKLAHEGNFYGLTFIDLGCGDFQVGQQLLPLCSSYIGIDIVKVLIENNNNKFKDTKASFLCLNIIEDDLPTGDVCFVRQVLQHLSNAEITKILSKLERYQWVFITEHYPTDNPNIVPNKDKIHGADIRLYDNSAVYLTEPPFCLSSESVQEVLTVPGEVGNVDQGFIKTFLYRPNHCSDHK